VAFRSSRAEPFGEAFLREALRRLFDRDVGGVREAYLAALDALRRREVPTHDVTSRVRMTKSPEAYAASREARREFAYEALLASGRQRWRVGEKVRVYRRTGGSGGEVDADDPSADPRDYDVDHYARVLRDNFASRLARAFRPEDFPTVFADPDQLSLFTPSAASVRPVLRPGPPPAAPPVAPESDPP
jgi:hypothetical protein